MNGCELNFINYSNDLHHSQIVIFQKNESIPSGEAADSFHVIQHLRPGTSHSFMIMGGDHISVSSTDPDAPLNAQVLQQTATGFSIAGMESASIIMSGDLAGGAVFGLQEG